MQQINLYQEEFRTQKDPLSAVLIGQVVAGSLAVIFVLAAAAGLMGWRAAVAAQDLKREVADLTEQSRLLAGELRARDKGASFAESVQLAERKLASSKTIRVFLGQLQRTDSEGFSTIMKDLARLTQTGLRLTTLELNSGGEVVGLTGEAVTSDLMPRFVKGLKKSESRLAEKAFSSRILQNESEIYQFELTTLVAED